MTISSASRKAGPFLGNGVTASFPFTFKVFTTSDIQVLKTSIGGADAVLVLNSDYSVALNADQNASPGGTITYPLSGVALATGEKLTATGVLAALQGTHITNGGNFFANNIEDQMDYLTILTQQLAEQTSRALIGSTTDVAPVLSLGTAAQRAGKFVAFDTNGNISLSVTLPSGTLSQASISVFLNPQNAAEAGKSIVPVNPFYPAQTALRYILSNATPGVTPMNGAIQAAIDSAYSGSATVKLSDQNGIAAPLMIRSTTQESIGLLGDARVVTELVAVGASIATGPVNVNAMIICQNNNAHLHLKQLRSADSNFTGNLMYALNGGGADGSCKASFSMVVDDCWFSPSSNGSGVFYGTYNNYQATKVVCESTKNGYMALAGAGNADINLNIFTMNACFDALINGSIDTLQKAIIQVNAVNCYGHFRGPLFPINNCVKLFISNIAVEAATAQIGTVGLGVFQDCTEIAVSDITGMSRTGVGVPQCAGPFIGVVNGATGKISNVLSDAVLGLQFSGSGALNLTVDNIDLSGGNQPFFFSSGTQTGTLVVRGSRFNNAQNECFSGGINCNVDIYESEFLNAGLNGNAANTNIDLNIASGCTVNLIRCKIGQNSVSAAAGSFFKNSGPGILNIIDPIPVGAAPVSLINAGSTGPINFDGVSSKSPWFAAAVPSVGGTSTGTGYIDWSLKGGVLSFDGRYTCTAIGTGSAITIQGLPFTSNASHYGCGVVAELASGNASVASLMFTVAPGSTSMLLRAFAAAGASSTSNPSMITTGTDLIFSGSYPI